MRQQSVQYQYEPLVTPAGWQGEERRFCVRLTTLMDTLFQRLGRLENRLAALESEREGAREHE